MALNLAPVSNGWRPGQSGNPKGAPKRKDGSLQDLCRAHTEEAVKTLIVCLRNPKERLPAAIAILDRGWGKPKQVIEGSPDGSPIHLHLLAAQIISAQLLQQEQSPPTINAEPNVPDNLLDAPPPSE
jgi:hypothetical protein